MRIDRSQTAGTPGRKYLLVRMSIVLSEPLISGMVLNANKDLFTGAAHPKGSLDGYYIWSAWAADAKAVERLEALAFIFRKMQEKTGVQTKRLVRLQERVNLKIHAVSLNRLTSGGP